MSNSLSTMLVGPIMGSHWKIDRRKEIGGAIVEYDVLPPEGRLPTGWVIVSVRLSGLDPSTQSEPPLVSLKIRSARDEAPRETSIMLQAADRPEFTSMTKLYAHSDSLLSVEVASRSEQIRLDQVSVRSISRFEAGGRLVLPRVKPILANPRNFRNLMSDVYTRFRRHGVSGIKSLMRHKVGAKHTSDDYSRWIYFYDTITPGDRQAIKDRIALLKNKPLLSVVMPVYNVREEYLRDAIESVRRQLYTNWELCIADDKSPSLHIRRVLAEYAALDSRIKVVYRSENGHISAASNSALELATGEFVVLLDHDDELTEHALYMVAEEINAHPTADLIYSDEDKINPVGTREIPHFKPEWNPDLLLSYNMITHLGVYRTSIIRRIGGFRLGFEGSQDYDLALRFIEQIPGSHVRHIPHILYHWRVIPGSAALSPDAKPYASIAARRAIQEHLDRRGIKAEVVEGVGAYHRVKYALPAVPPLVSLIICTRDRLNLLKGAVDGVLDKTDYPNLELIIVDNDSRESETLAFFESIKKDPRVKVIRSEAPFNFSALNNLGVRHASGALIGLINNDIEVIHSDWLKEMASHALRPEIGAVGAKLFYPDKSIQHAGVLLGIGEVAGESHGVAGHAHKGFSCESFGYIGRLVVTQNYSAVTGACMIMRRSVYDEVGGLDEVNLSVAFNDVDLCLRIGAQGYRVVYTPHAELYHLESASRGSDQTPENIQRFSREIQYMMARWKPVLANDPCYSPNLTLKHENLAIAYPPRALKPWKYLLNEQLQLQTATARGV